jgi:hypothetical protein
MDVNQLEKIFSSLKLNYKSWILIFICIIFIPTSTHLVNNFFTYFLMMFLSYIFHFTSHFENKNNSVHLYHHNNNNWFSHFIQIVLEFSTLLLLIPINYILNLNIVNNWVIIFFYLFYTTVHNINYSFFHVNDTHEKHHNETSTNLGPDICDIIFYTKYNEEIENTDHYIFNIIFSYLVVISLFEFWDKSNENQKIYLKLIFVLFYIFSGVIILYFTIYLNETKKETKNKQKINKKEIKRNKKKQKEMKKETKKI